MWRLGSAGCPLGPWASAADDASPIRATRTIPAFFMASPLPTHCGSDMGSVCGRRLAVLAAGAKLCALCAKVAYLKYLPRHVDRHGDGPDGFESCPGGSL